MKTYEVYYTDPETGATSCIDNVKAIAPYTAADYIADCTENADQEWCDMLAKGEVDVMAVED